MGLQGGGETSPGMNGHLGCGRPRRAAQGPGRAASVPPGQGLTPVPRLPSQARLRAVHPHFPGTLGAGVRPAGPGDSILPQSPLFGGTLTRGQDGPLHILCLLFN